MYVVDETVKQCNHLKCLLYNVHVQTLCSVEPVVHNEGNSILVDFSDKTSKSLI